jgi:hypothetical protein
VDGPSHPASAPASAAAAAALASDGPLVFASHRGLVLVPPYGPSHPLVDVRCVLVVVFFCVFCFVFICCWLLFF